MQWQVKGARFTLPEAIVPGESFRVDKQDIVWNKALRTLVVTGADGVERMVHVRSATLTSFEGEAATNVALELVASSPKGVVSFTGSVEPWVPGQAGRGKADGAKALHVRSQITGKVLKVLVKAGDKVNAGDTLLIVEAMKMENRIFAPHAGQVAAVTVKEGDSVATGKELVRLANA
jgi:biotin carboxyl carrier protein